ERIRVRAGAAVAGRSGRGAGDLGNAALFAQDLDRHRKLAGELLQERFAVNGRAHAGEELEDPVRLARERRAGKSGEARGRVLDPAAREVQLRPERESSVAHEEVAGIEAAPERHDVDLEVEREEAVESLVRGLGAGFVAVEHEGRAAGSG